MLAEEFIYQTAKTHREEAICEAKREIRGGFRIARAKRSNPCYYLIISWTKLKTFVANATTYGEAGRFMSEIWTAVNSNVEEIHNEHINRKQFGL